MTKVTSLAGNANNDKHGVCNRKKGSPDIFGILLYLKLPSRSASEGA